LWEVAINTFDPKVPVAVAIAVRPSSAMGFTLLLIWPIRTGSIRLDGLTGRYTLEWPSLSDIFCVNPLRGSCGYVPTNLRFPSILQKLAGKYTFQRFPIGGVFSGVRIPKVINPDFFSTQHKMHI
jgi:hypothetical protein